MARCSAASNKAYGVPGEVLVAIWGLETDFGANIGKFPTIRSLATLAYDCRRVGHVPRRADGCAAHHRARRSRAVGNARRLGRRDRPDPVHAVVLYQICRDFDGNGRRDLLHSAPDVLASTANYLAGYGWQRGKDWEPGSANFAVIQQWNKSEVYARTIAYFATQLARAP